MLFLAGFFIGMAIGILGTVMVLEFHGSQRMGKVGKKDYYK